MRQKKKAAEDAAAEEAEDDPAFPCDAPTWWGTDDKWAGCTNATYADAQGKGEMTGRETEKGSDNYYQNPDFPDPCFMINSTSEVMEDKEAGGNCWKQDPRFPPMPAFSIDDMVAGTNSHNAYAVRR